MDIANRKTPLTINHKRLTNKMSVKIRLTKTGKKNQIQYRIVAQDTRTKRDGKVLEILGNFNPLTGGNNVTLKKTEYEAWIKKGAKPTPSVSYLLEFGKLPKKPKKVKAEAKIPDQKPPETAPEKTETQKEEETKQPEPKPEADESKVDSHPAEENVNPDQDENPKADETKEETKA